MGGCTKKSRILTVIASKYHLCRRVIVIVAAETAGIEVIAVFVSNYLPSISLSMLVFQY
jgi:hypothetical protein